MSLRHLLLLTIFSLLLGGCDRTTAEQHLEKARQNAASDELPAAVIELKNALRKEPDLVAGRALLGRVYERQGDFAAALKEYERALDNGVDTDEVKLGVLRSKLRVGRFREVLGELEPKASLELPFALLLGDAYLAAGDLDKAQALYSRGEDSAAGNLGLGLIAWQRGDLERAEQYLTEAVRLDPGSGDAWIKLGEFALEQRQAEAAERAFQAAAKLPATRIMGEFGLARTMLVRERLDEAASRIDEVLRLAPDYLPARYLSGVIRFEQRDLAAAQKALEQVLKRFPEHPPSLFLLGTVNYHQGDLKQAETRLQKFLSSSPDDASARKLLASIRFDRGDLPGVVSALEGLAAREDDPQVLAMYGSAQMRLGHAAEATRALEKAVELAPDMAAFRNQLALSLVSVGDSARAKAELEAAVEIDADQFQSDYLLALVRMREEDWKGALEAANALLAKSPDSPFGHNLLGAIHLASGDVETARGNFEAALERDPEFLPAVQNLAGIAGVEGGADAEREVYETLLQRSPGNEGALIALADLELGAGNPEAAVARLEKAVAANPTSVRSRLGLARVYLSLNRLDDSGRMADAALELVPAQPDLLFLQAELALRRGDADAAREAAAELQSQLTEQPENVAYHVALGSLQARIGSVVQARSNLQKGLELAKGRNAAALQELARLDLRDRNVRAARGRLKALEQLGEQGPDVRLLKADIHLAAGDRRAGEAIYADLVKAGEREALLRLARMRLAEGSNDAAADLLEGWLEGHPADTGVRLLLADSLLATHPQRAIGHYETLIPTEQPVVFNNLAWLYLQQGDSRAEATARRAHELASDDPNVLDTLGWVLLKQGDHPEAVRLLRRSVRLNASNPSVQYHLGLALRESGDTEGARKALSRAVAAGDFPEQDDARAALKALPST